MKLRITIAAFCCATTLQAQAPSPAPSGTACTIAETLQSLPVDVRETSGLVRGRATTDVFWTHNDSGNQPEIIAIGNDRTIRARVAVKGVPFTDWEDLEGGTCGSSNCLYIADIGDNDGARKYISIYEIEEPMTNTKEVTPRRVLNARYVEGAQDAEALFRLPNGEIYIVTKGRQKAVTLYRLSLAGTGDLATLQRVRELAPKAKDELDRVTAATASADGRFVAIRSYRTLWVYRTEDLLGGADATLTFSLTPLNEKQGEALAFDMDGSIVVTSEAEMKEDVPTIGRIRCTLTGDR